MRPRGIESRLDGAGVRRYRAFAKTNGRKIRGPWTPSLDEAIRHREEFLGSTRLERERATGMLYEGAAHEGTQGSVYFIQAGTGPIKIGHSRAGASSRLSVLQTAHYEDLRILGEVLGPKGSEYRFHVLFAEHRIRGEWFAPEAVLAAAPWDPSWDPATPERDRSCPEEDSAGRDIDQDSSRHNPLESGTF